jgi:hypothetical protein
MPGDLDILLGDSSVDAGDHQFSAIFKKRWRLGSIGDENIDVAIVNVK